MSETLASATLKLAKILTHVVSGTASGGTTTTLVDSDFPWQNSGGVVPADDHYNGGTIWFTSGDNDGITEMITDWAKTTKTFTFATLSDAIVSGVKYSACNMKYPRYILQEAINYALSNIGDVPQLYTNAAFITVADQINYDLPSGVYNVLKVEIARSTSTPYDFVEHKHWREIEDDIYFDENSQPSEDDYPIRLTYCVPPTSLTADSSAISDYIHIDRLKWEAAVYALRWKLQMTGGDEQVIATVLQEALAMAEAMKHKHPVKHIMKSPHVAFWRRSTINRYDN